MSKHLSQHSSSHQHPSLRAGFGVAIQGRKDCAGRPWIAVPQARLAMTDGFGTACSGLGR